MSREILFRGKVTDIPLYRQDKTKIGTWVYGSYVSYPVPRIFNLEDEYVVYLRTVGQFTGLYDKNGVTKIFEGDILYCEARLDKAEMYVVFEQGQFRMVLCDKFKEYETGRGYYDINSFQKTVIGNIHETGIDNNSGF